jgi:malate synthase
MSGVPEVPGVAIVGEPQPRASDVLTEQSLGLVADLHRRFAGRRAELLAARAGRRAQAASTGQLDFLPETADVRAGDWRVPPPPADLADRRVEITGPTEPKMAINALNSGAKVWLADLEDANTPHLSNVVGGQVVLFDAVRRQLAFTSADGKEYRLRDDVRLAVMLPRPRGWHLDERHILVDGEPTVGAFVDAGLYLANNAAELIARGSGPYFYLPKTESHLEARLWHDVFSHVESVLGLPSGTIRATALIETIPAAFEMDEILYELGDHAAGLNAGRWDYLFSIIKYFRDAGADFVLPDRSAVTMTAPMMRAYTELLVRTCHRRGAMAIGGMAAFIPSRRDAEVNAVAMGKVRADKEREAGDGFDGSWVAHPDLVPICQEVFDAALGERPNQLDRTRDEVSVTAAQLLDAKATGGAVTENGVRENVSVAVQYLASWLGGSGAVGINNLMEDAATAEISRSQIWQWIANGVVLDTGETVTADLVRRLLAQEDEAIRAGAASRGHEQYVDAARSLFEQVALGSDFPDFLTLPAYRLVLDQEASVT